jgi:GTP-binding protein HflX
VEEIVALVKETNLELVIFSSELSPSQERNLEQQLECQVMDRTGLIFLNAY